MTRADGRLPATARELEAAAAALVSSAPPSPAQLEAARLLAERAAEEFSGLAYEEAALAAACARCLAALESGDIAPGPALLYVASASACLASAAAARSGGRTADPRALRAARHEVDSFAPSAGRGPKAPDVPASSLLRRGR